MRGVGVAMSTKKRRTAGKPKQAASVPLRGRPVNRDQASAKRERRPPAAAGGSRASTRRDRRRSCRGTQVARALAGGDRYPAAGRRCFSMRRPLFSGTRICGDVPPHSDVPAGHTAGGYDRVGSRAAIIRRQSAREEQWSPRGSRGVPARRAARAERWPTAASS